MQYCDKICRSVSELGQTGQSQLRDSAINRRCDETPHQPHRPHRQEINTPSLKRPVRGLRGCQTNNKVGRLLRAWLSYPTKSADKIGEP